MKPMIVFIRKNLKKKIHGKKNSKWLPKKVHFPVLPTFIFLKKNFQGLVLGLVGLIDAKGIDVVQPIWF